MKNMKSVLAVGPINLANPEKTYYTYYSLQQWGKHEKSGFLSGRSTNMMTIAKKDLASYPKKPSLIRKKTLSNSEKTSLIRK